MYGLRSDRQFHYFLAGSTPHAISRYIFLTSTSTSACPAPRRHKNEKNVTLSPLAVELLDWLNYDVLCAARDDAAGRRSCDVYNLRLFAIPDDANWLR